MKSDILLDAIGEIGDDLIAEAESPLRTKSPVPRIILRYAGIAAAVAVVIFTLFRFAPIPPQHFPLGGDGLSGSSSGGSTTGTSPGNAGAPNTETARTITPLLPLTLAEDAEGVTADRTLTLSLETPSRGTMTDAYTLTNTTGEDKTVTALYPIVTSVSMLSENPVSAAVNGESVTPEIYPGVYAGDYADGMEPSGFSSYEALDAVLSDGSYLKEALTPAPALDIPVTVYKLTDYVYSSDKSAANPTLRMEFDIDHTKTSVLSYGFNGASIDDDREIRTVGGLNGRENKKDAYLIMVGEDIASYTLTGYATGGFDTKKTLPDVSANVIRYETTLGEVLHEVIDLYSNEDSELKYTLTAKLYAFRFGLLDSVSRSEWVEMQENNAWHYVRVVYAGVPVTIPAGESVTLVFSREVQGSWDYIKNDYYGYDILTKSGSNLDFSPQKVILSGIEKLTVEDTNLPDSGALDAGEPHYWLHIRGH